MWSRSLSLAVSIWCIEIRGQGRGRGRALLFSGLRLKRGQTNDEKTGKGNHDIASLVVFAKLQVSNRRPDHEADEHPNPTSNERLATTKILNNIQTRESHAKVDGTEDDLGDVAVETNGRENAVAKVEDEVGSSELLQRLQDDTQDGPVEHARTSEDLVPGGGTGVLLLFELFLHVLHLLGDATVVGRDTVQFAHNLAGFLEAAVAVGISGRLRQEESTNTQDEWPGKADTHGDTPGRSGLDGVGAVIDDIGDEDTKGDEELEGTDHGTTNLPGSRLTLVHGHDAGQSTNTQAGNQPTNSNLVPFCGRRDLDDDADDVDDRPEGDG